MTDPWRYRNKSQIPVGKNEQNEVIMGFYRQRSHDIIDMESCLIQDSQHQEVMNEVKSILKDLNVSIYQEQLKKRFNETFGCKNRISYRRNDDYFCN